MICPACHKNFRYTKLKNVNYRKGFTCPVCNVKIASNLTELEDVMNAISTGVFVHVALYSAYKLTDFILSPLTKKEEPVMFLFIFPFLVFMYVYIRATQESVKMYINNESKSNQVKKRMDYKYSFFSVSNLVIFAINLAIAIFFLLKEYLPKFY